MEAKPTWYYLAPILLVLGTLLAAANSYLRPDRAVPWIVSMLLLGVMAMVLAVVTRGSSDDVARRRAAESIRSAIVFAGLILVFTLSVSLINAIHATGNRDISERVTMAIMGAYLVFTGNIIPKTLSPLSTVPGDTARVQALQRLAGWTWVVTGFIYAIAWLVLPWSLAEPITFVLLPAAMLLILVQLFRLRRARQHPA